MKLRDMKDRIGAPFNTLVRYSEYWVGDSNVHHESQRPITAHSE